ncbi:MAG: family 10 glycosylhydrolase [Leptolyngbya sp. SIO1D8]|nr:family 10 glycosylhydrolase [Leptolyngbya sp. SIO1D8]
MGLTVLTAVLVWTWQGLVWLAPGNTSNPTSAELRGVWLTNVDSQVLFSTEALENSLQRLADTHFNTVYPAVWSWGYTLYPSLVGQRVIGYKQGLYPDLEAEGRNEVLEATQVDRDVLLEIVTLAHERGLSVIPWFEFGFMAPANSPLAQRHPDWLTNKRGQLPDSRLEQEGRHTRVWLNPFHPEVQQFILDLIAELMDTYPVDGLQLDDHFSLPVGFGYDPYTVSLYRQEHAGRFPPANVHDPKWMRWRAEKLTQFLGSVFQVIKARRPNAVLSVSPNPAQFAYNRFLQDWPRWREIGYIEELIVQVYRDSVSGFRHTLQDVEIQRASQHIPTAVGILSGLKDRPVPMSLIQRQVQVAREMGIAGVSFFFYDTLWTLAEGEARGDRISAIQQLFAIPQERPRI